jgi:hypothetical protein
MHRDIILYPGGPIFIEKDQFLRLNREMSDMYVQPKVPQVTGYVFHGPSQTSPLFGREFR